MHIAIRKTQHPRHLYDEHTSSYSLKFIAAYVLTIMAYPHRIMPMYDVTTEFANHAKRLA